MLILHLSCAVYSGGCFSWPTRMLVALCWFTFAFTFVSCFYLFLSLPLSLPINSYFNCPLFPLLFVFLSVFFLRRVSGLVWFCLSRDHGWICSGSVNVKYTITTKNGETQLKDSRQRYIPGNRRRTFIIGYPGEVTVQQHLITSTTTAAALGDTPALNRSGTRATRQGLVRRFLWLLRQPGSFDRSARPCCRPPTGLLVQRNILYSLVPYARVK